VIDCKSDENENELKRSEYERTTSSSLALLNVTTHLSTHRPSINYITAMRYGAAVGSFGPAAGLLCR